MASLSPQGERSVLALVAEQYAAIVDLREALTAERDAHAITRGDLDRLREAVLSGAEATA